MENEERNIIDHLKNLLSDTKYVSDNNLNRSILINDLKNKDDKVLEILLNDSYINNSFTNVISSYTIFNIEDLINVVRHKEYLSDSYTQYANEIGLTSDGRSLKSLTNTVLSFPYKDNVLVAGMTKEDVEQLSKSESEELNFGNKEKKKFNSTAKSLQTDEIFLNEVIANDDIAKLKEPKAFINIKKYDRENPEGKEIDSITDDDNLVVKGNNLIALHSLVRRYKSKVKLIYIDPPYYFDSSQDSDTFPYNSNFSMSTWLTFMKNRIDASLPFLDAGGYLAIQMNDHGVFHLKVLLDEIFESTNGGFVNSISVKMSDLSGPKMAHVNKKVPKIKEHILLYTNDYSNSHLNSVRIESTWDEAIDDKRYTSYVDKNNSENIEDWEYTTVRRKLNEMELEYGEQEAYDFLFNNAANVFRTAANSSLTKIAVENNLPRDKFSPITTESGLNKYIFKNEEVIFASSKMENINGRLVPSESTSDMWDDIALNDLSNEGQITFKNGQKPEMLLARIIELTTNTNDLVMDYFMGSATTQAVALKTERRFIGIEQMDYISNISVQRLINTINGEQRGISRKYNWTGNGDFIYAELFEDNQKFVNLISDATETDRVWEIYNEMKSIANFRFQVKLDNLEKNKLPEDIPLIKLKELMIGVLKTSALYVNAMESDDPNIELNEFERTFNKNFYLREDNN